MKKKKVIIFSVNYTPYVSGAEQFVIEVAGRLAGRYECTVITARFDRALKKQETVQGKTGAYSVLRVGIGHTFFDKFLYVILAPLKARVLRPDILHAVMESYAGGALVVYGWITRAPRALRVLTLQSGEQYSLRKRLKVPWFLRALIHRAPDRITAISSYLKERARHWGARDITVIPNGVDRGAIEKIAGGAPERVPHRIVCVARLSWEKGLEYLIDALVHILEEYKDAHLVLVGGGPLEAALRQRARQKGVAVSVQFLGALSHKRAVEEMARAQVFACPSLFEGLGIVFIEAQAVGTPVVGTQVGGIPDVIEDGVTGVLVPPKSSHALAVAIKSLFDSPQEAETLAESAKKRLSRYEWDSITEQVVHVYESR